MRRSRSRRALSPTACSACSARCWTTAARAKRRRASAPACVAQSVFMKFSRDDEREADRVGAEIMQRAGWDPHGLAEFMQVLQQEQQRSPSSVETFFSSHPSPAGRVRDLQGMVTGKSGRRDSDEFQAIKSRLNSLPAAAGDAQDQLARYATPASPRPFGKGRRERPHLPAARPAFRPLAPRPSPRTRRRASKADRVLAEFRLFLRLYDQLRHPPPLKFPRRREPTPRLAWMPGFAS